MEPQIIPGTREGKKISKSQHQNASYSQILGTTGLSRGVGGTPPVILGEVSQGEAPAFFSCPVWRRLGANFPQWMSFHPTQGAIFNIRVIWEERHLPLWEEMVSLLSAKPNAVISPQSVWWEDDDKGNSHYLISAYYVITSLNYHYYSYSLKAYDYWYLFIWCISRAYYVPGTLPST